MVILMEALAELACIVLVVVDVSRPFSDCTVDVCARCNAVDLRQVVFVAN